MAAGAAPEVPVLAYLVVGLLAMLSWVVLRGMTAAYRSTFGWLLEQLAGILDFHVSFVHVDLGGPVRALNNAFLHVLGAGAAKSEHAMGYFFHGAAVLQEWATRELLHLAAETLGWAQWLQHVHLPRWVKTVASLAFPPLLIARLVRAAVRGELPHLVRTVKVYTQGAVTTVYRATALPHLAEWQWLHRHWRSLQHAIAVAGAVSIPLAFPWVHVFPRIKVLERFEVTTRKRLHRLEGLLGVTGLAIALANVLGLPNWRCLTRGNVGKTARALCGLDPALLAGLLGGLALLETPFSIEELASEALAIEEELIGLVTGAISELQGIA